MAAGGATARKGYRGYVASRPILGHRVPQHIQNLVLRDYAQRNQLAYLLSATEYTWPHSYLMLEAVMQELATLEGAIAYSLFMLPWRQERRRAVYDRVLGAGASLHFAVEGMALKSAGDVGDLEEVYQVQQAVLLPGQDGLVDQLRRDAS